MRKQYLALILAAAIALPQILGTGQVAYASQMPEEQITEGAGKEETAAEASEELEVLEDERASDNKKSKLPETEAAEAKRENAIAQMPDESKGQEAETKQEDTAKPKEMFQNAVKGNAEETDLTIYIFDGDKYESYEISGDSSLPAGISYDASNNVLNLENVKNIDCISYGDTKRLTICLTNSNVELIQHMSSGDLVIEANGKNQLKTISSSPSGYKAGDIYLKGTGVIEASYDDDELTDFVHQEAWDFDADNKVILADAGDIYIEDITIISHNGAGIMSCNSNVTIRNAILKINDQASWERWVGITTGMADWNGAYKGLLTIENSEIEIKKCTLGLAWNRINMTGCNLYLGESSPEYQINPAKAASYDDYGSFKRGYFENINYLKITKDNLQLPVAYALVDGTASNAGGTISMPEFAVAGKKINVDIHCDDSYTLSKLYVNGTAISGTSFTMPDKDTTVKAVFVKKEVKVTKISLSGISKKIASGKKITLKADVFPSNATNKAVTWKSSNTKYATVNSKGVVTMKKAGKGKTVTITATAKDGSQTKAAYKIKCMKGVVKKIKLSAAKSVKAGKKVTVKNKVTASKGANTALTYSVSNKKYAAVNKKGVVTTKKAGKGKTITVMAKATDGSGKKATVKIKIK